MSDERRRAPIPPAPSVPPPTTPEQDPLFMALLKADDALNRAIDGYNSDSGVGIYGEYVLGQLGRVIASCQNALLEVQRAQQLAAAAPIAAVDEDDVDTPLCPSVGHSDPQGKGGEG